MEGKGMSLKSRMNVTPYSGVQYSREKYPALKMFFPLDEGSGLEFLDHAGGRVWTPSITGDVDTGKIHSTPHAVTLAATQSSEDSQIAGVITGADIPAPGTTKVAVLVLTFGAVPNASADDYWYFRLGDTSTVGNNPGAMTWNVNSKGDGSNAFKTNAISTPETQPNISVLPMPINTPVVFGLSAEWTAATTTMVGKDQRNTTVYTGTDTAAHSMDTIVSTMQMQLAHTIDLGVEQKLYSVQYWLFDSLPSDMTAALMWTRDNALAGNKTPYPGWRHKQ